jgi:hypothetical protein
VRILRQGLRALKRNSENVLMILTLSYRGGEDDVDLKMLEDLDDDGTGAMVEDGITLMEEEYDGMIVEEDPEANDKEAVHRYLNMELRMGAGTDDERWGRVIKCAKGIGGEPVSHAHANPFFDTREYEVEFTNGTIE